MIKIRQECEGYYKIEAVKADGSRRLLADWFPNLILDSGLDRMGDHNDYLSWCQVGSGSTAPAATQTSLVSRTAGTNVVQSRVTANSGAEPYYARNTATFRFNAGTATGVHAEVGVGWATSGSLYSRALILDALGTPTTITVLADESLDVTYELRIYVWTDTGAGAITLNGVAHTTVLKSAQAGLWQASSLNLNAGYAAGGPIRAYTGTVSATVAGSPSGTEIGSVTQSFVAYTPLSNERKFNIAAGLNDFNNAAGIGAIRIAAGWGFWQIGFTPNIMKTSDQVLSLQVKHSWGRKA